MAPGQAAGPTASGSEALGEQGVQVLWPRNRAAVSRRTVCLPPQVTCREKACCHEQGIRERDQAQSKVMAETEGQNIPAPKTRVGSGFLLLCSFPAPTRFHDSTPSVTEDFIFANVLPLTTANAGGRLEKDSRALSHSESSSQPPPNAASSVMLELLSICSGHHGSHEPRATRYLCGPGNVAEKWKFPPCFL